MKIKKFESYTIDTDDDISIEYAKLIVSAYIDKKDDESLESVYAEIVKGDELEEDQAYIIKNELQDYLYKLFEEAKKIRPIIEIEASKYNIG